MHASIQLATERRRFPVCLIGMLLLLLSACASTQLVGHWRDPSFRGPALHKVLVVGVQSDQVRRRLWEDSMAAALRELGVAATAAYQSFPGEVPSAEQLTVTAARAGFDAVMATQVVGTRTQLYWLAANPGLGFGSRWRYFDYWDATRGTGYVQVLGQLDYQSNIFTVGPNGGKLIWTGTTRSPEPSSMQGVAEQISRALVPALQQAGILSRQKT